MNQTALQILRAALERIGATNGDAVNQNVDGDARECVACGHYVDHCAVQSCEGHIARAALEAAAKAPWLADDVGARVAVSNALYAHPPDDPCDRVLAVLRAIDAYQLGDK